MNESCVGYVSRLRENTIKREKHKKRKFMAVASNVNPVSCLKCVGKTKIWTGRNDARRTYRPLPSHKSQSGHLTAGTCCCCTGVSASAVSKTLAAADSSFSPPKRATGTRYDGWGRDGDGHWRDCSVWTEKAVQVGMMEMVRRMDARMAVKRDDVVFIMVVLFFKRGGTSNE